MGEIADDMIEGRACALCGQYFVYKNDQDTMYEHGHPVICNDCFEDEGSACGYQRQSKKATTL